MHARTGTDDRATTCAELARPSSWGHHRGDSIAAGRTVVSRLGGGAEYEVLVVEDERFGRAVAKVVRPHLVAAGAACALLAREAAALAAISSPFVVRALDVELEADPPHLLIEHVEGLTLRRLLRRRGRLGPDEVVCLGATLALALAAVADSGWVHLDVKPENVVMASPACLLDFSISQRVHGAVAADPLVGTPAYMAPEQHPGAAGTLGPAADVYALAVTLTEALTGELPAGAGIRSQLLPPPFESLLGRALAPHPDVRPSAAELADALLAPLEAAGGRAVRRRVG